VVVSGKGKFLIPGLWDMHVHLWYEQNQLPVYLAFGVTGVQDMGSTFYRVARWRAEIVEGKADGPHVVTCGPPVVEKPTGDPKLPGIVATTPDEARRAFDQLWDMDVDFIKVLSGLSRDAYFALAEQARHWDVRMAGHVPRAVTAWEAIDARQGSLEHLFGVQGAVLTDNALDEKKAVAFFERAALFGVRQAPTLLLWRRMGHIDDEKLKTDTRLKYVPEAIRKTWPDAGAEARDWSLAGRTQWQVQVDRIYRLVALAKRTKVELLAGTDTGDPYTIPGASLHDELDELVRAGLTPREALEAATVAPARFLGWDEAMGTVEKGKVADLVLLDADPLDDIRNTRKIAAVFARGKHYSRKDLDAILAAVK
jgi:imidazolonepropionase-like amidohydrolase